MHVGIAYLRWRGKRSRHSRRMRTRKFAYLARGPWQEGRRLIGSNISMHCWDICLKWGYYCTCTRTPSIAPYMAFWMIFFVYACIGYISVFILRLIGYSYELTLDLWDKIKQSHHILSNMRLNQRFSIHFQGRIRANHRLIADYTYFIIISYQCLRTI